MRTITSFKHGFTTPSGFAVHPFKKLKGNLSRFSSLTVLWTYALMVFLILPLNAQNPYECAMEELFLNAPAVREQHESKDCGIVAEIINKFNEAYSRRDVREKFNLLKSVSFFRCQETFNFLENQIKNSRSETDRCNAMINLAWMLEPDYLSVIQQYANKPSLTLQEKSAVATALMIYGVRESLPRLVTQSLQILSEICNDAPENVLENCIVSYGLEGGSAAKSFFNSQLQQEEYKLYAAVFLAQLGEHKQTFPIFAAALGGLLNSPFKRAKPLRVRSRGTFSKRSDCKRTT